jgi:acyl dehydratase
VKPRAGDNIPEWVMESVSAQRMKTMAAILRDPNPLHWDREAVAALPLELGQRTINQGPLGLSYIINMLHAWMGPACIQRIKMTFPQVVLDGDRVVARGIIDAVDGDAAQCQVWLEHGDGRRLLEGWATVRLGLKLRDA